MIFALDAMFRNNRLCPVRMAPTVADKDVFIVARVAPLLGVCIGEGAVVAAGSVVTRSVSAGSIVGRRSGSRCTNWG